MDQPAAPRLFGDPVVTETFGGVVYRFRGLPRSSWPTLRFLLVVLVLEAVPAAAAVASLVFLVAFAGQLPWYLAALPCLFVLQAGLLAGLCFTMVGRFCRHVLFDLFGRHEMELDRGWLYWGKRAGRFRDGYRHAVAELRRLLVCCYTASGGEREATLGVKPLSGEGPTFYCCGCGEQEVLALARDFHMHLLRVSDVPLEVVETTEEDALRRAGMAGQPTVPAKVPLWQRRCVWYPWHVAGLVGLLALLAAVRSVGLAVPPWLYLLFVLAALLQLAAIGNRPTK